MRRAAALLPLLAGCAIAPAPAEILVDQREPAVIAALGTPARVREADGLRVLHYEDHRVVAQPLDPVWSRPVGGYGPFPAAAPALRAGGCDTLVTLRDGVVQSFARRGDDCR